MRLSNYFGRDLVPRDSCAVFLDWDDTLFPSTWIQIQQRSRGLHLLRKDPAIKALCGEIISFLCTVSRIGHVFIVTNAAPGFITKCCHICFPELLPVFDELKVTLIYARPRYDEEGEEAVETWKESAYRMILQGRSIRPLVPELARFYGAPAWSSLLSYADEWSDHAALRSVAAAVSPESVLTAVKARSADSALSAEDLSKELAMVGGLFRHMSRIEVDFPLDMDKEDHRVLVEELTSPRPTNQSLKGSSHVSFGSDWRSDSRSASTSLPTSTESIPDFFIVPNYACTSSSEFPQQFKPARKSVSKTAAGAHSSFSQAALKAESSCDDVCCLDSEASSCSATGAA